MRIDRKKAQGEIITTILIILLVLAVVVIVWQVIKGTVEKGAEEVESKSQCIGLDLTAESVKCTTTAPGNIEVTVHRGADSITATTLRVLATGTDGASIAATDSSIVALGTAKVSVPTLLKTPATNGKTTVTVALVIGTTVCEGETQEFTC